MNLTRIYRNNKNKNENEKTVEKKNKKKELKNMKKIMAELYNYGIFQFNLMVSKKLSSIEIFFFSDEPEKANEMKLLMNPWE